MGEKEGDQMAPVAAKKSAGLKSKGNKVMQFADKAQALAGNIRKDLGNRFDGAGDEAKARAAKLAVMLIKLQQSTFDKALKMLSQVQARGDKLVKKHVEDAAWLPAEGKEVIKEWSRTLNDGRAEFQKAVDKSYDLLSTYFQRVQKSAKPAAKKTAALVKKSPIGKKKPAAKKKVVAKRKTSTNSTMHTK
jgi:hypothetical protein